MDIWYEFSYTNYSMKVYSIHIIRADTEHHHLSTPLKISDFVD